MLDRFEIDEFVALSLEPSWVCPARSMPTRAETMLSVSMPEPMPPNVIVPAISSYSSRARCQKCRGRRDRCRYAPPSCICSASAEEAEGQLRQLVGLGQDGDTGLAENL